MKVKEEGRKEGWMDGWSHFVFFKLICPGERTPPTTPKILKAGRRKSAVTTQEKIVSWANEEDVRKKSVGDVGGYWARDIYMRQTWNRARGGI
jgi:hypothetical protein